MNVVICMRAVYACVNVQTCCNGFTHWFQYCVYTHITSIVTHLHADARAGGVKRGCGDPLAVVDAGGIDQVDCARRRDLEERGEIPSRNMRATELARDVKLIFGFYAITQGSHTLSHTRLVATGNTGMHQPIGTTVGAILGPHLCSSRRQ